LKKKQGPSSFSLISGPSSFLPFGPPLSLLPVVLRQAQLKLRPQQKDRAQGRRKKEKERGASSIPTCDLQLTTNDTGHSTRPLALINRRETTYIIKQTTQINRRETTYIIKQTTQAAHVLAIKEKEPTYIIKQRR
jgi:hypothetical protein